MTLPIQPRQTPQAPPPHGYMPAARRTAEAPPQQPTPMPKSPARPAHDPGRDGGGLERMHDALEQRLANLRATRAGNPTEQREAPAGSERIVHHRHLNARLANAAKTRPSDDAPPAPETPPAQGGMPTDVREVPADPVTEGEGEPGVHPRRLINQLGKEVRETLRDLRGQMAEEGNSDLGGDIRGLAREFRDSVRDIRHRAGEGELDRMGVLGEIASALQTLSDGLGGLFGGDDEPAPTGDPREGPTQFLFDGDVSATPAGVPSTPPTTEEPPAGPTKIVFDGSVSATPAGVPTPPPVVEEPPAGPTKIVFDGTVSATPAGVPTTPPVVDQPPAGPTAYLFDGEVAATPAGVPPSAPDVAPPTAGTTDAPMEVPGGEQPEQPNARRLMQGVLSRLRDAFESFRSGLKPTGLPSDPSQGAPDGSGPEVTPAGDAPRDDVRGAGGMPLADRLAAARAAFSGLGEHQEPGRRFERVG